MKEPSPDPAVVGFTVRTNETPPPSSTSISGERRRVFDVAAIGMGILAADGRWLSANGALCALLGCTLDELLSTTLSGITHPDDVPDDDLELARLVAREVVVCDREKRLLRSAGTTVWVHQQVTVSFDSAGKPLHFIWQGWDITDERASREAKAAAEALLRVVVSHAPIVLWAVDDEGVFTLVEGSARDDGAAEGMSVGRSAFDFYAGLQLIEGAGRIAPGDALLRRALAGESCAGLAEIGPHRDDTKLVPLRGPGGAVAGVIGVATDVTERVHAETTRRASEASFRALIESAPEMILVHRTGKVVYVNPAAASVLGHAEQGSLIGLDLAEIVHGDDHPSFASIVDLMVRTGKGAPSQELRLLRRGGTTFVAELVAVPLVFDGEPAVASIARDITERKSMQARLLQTDRLVALGTLAAGVAHEINNPLTYVMGNVDLVSRLLRARAGDCRAVDQVSGPLIAAALEELTKTLEVARDGAERVRRIVRDLTTFARSETDRRTLLDVRSVLEPVVNLVSNELRQRARLTRDLGDVPLVDANEARLGQVFMNLLMNAVHAIPEGHAEEHEIGIATFTDPAGRAVLEVRDTGVGIPEDVVGRIFEPFFTTKPTGLGTGLGLSICHGTVTALGGEISVKSSPGEGSVFRVAIPGAARTRPQPRPSSPSREGGSKRARVLVIDDEPLILESLKRALSRYEVGVATRAKDALERINGGERFDVILCDLLMPGMSGMELGEELAKSVPEQAGRMVFTTGGAFTARAREFLDRAKNPCIEKPFDLPKLYALIHDIATKTSA